MNHDLELSRRQALLGGAAAGFLYVGGSGLGGTTTLSPDSAVRIEDVRPIQGGTVVSCEETDGYGTLGVVVDYNGSDCALTNRHVLDKGSDETPSDVEGRLCYQPDSDDGGFATVTEASTIGGADSSDWALLGVADLIDATYRTLAFGELASPTTPTQGERIVMDSAIDGLLGGTVRETGVNLKWRDAEYTDLVRYTVDDDEDTDGNSGSVVATVDPTSYDVQPVGLHTFSDGSDRYAIPWSDLPSGVSVASGGSSAQVDTTEEIDGTVAAYDGSDVHILVSNLGDAQTEASVYVEEVDSGSTLIDTQTTVSGLGQSHLSAATTASSVYLQVGGETTEVDL